MAGIHATCWRGAIALTLNAVLLASCTSLNVKPADVANVKAIGVVSVCGDTIIRESMGLLALNDDYTTGNISAWHLDDYAVEITKSDLEPRFAVERIDANPARLNVDLSKITTLSSYRTMTPQNIEAVLPSALLPNQPPVDAYLIISSGEVPAPPDGADKMYGMGIWSRGGWRVVHASCEVTLIDAHTFKMLGRGVTTGLKAFPSELRHDHWNDYTDPERQIIREDLKEALKDGLDKTLETLAASNAK